MKRNTLSDGNKYLNLAQLGKIKLLLLVKFCDFARTMRIIVLTKQ